MAFQKALSYDDQKIKINPDEIPVEATYSGPKIDKIEDINSEWI